MMLPCEEILYWSNPDAAFLADVLELPGCAANGRTYQEALENIQMVPKEATTDRA